MVTQQDADKSNDFLPSTLEESEQSSSAVLAFGKKPSKYCLV
jgi:hypothetical protein